MSRPLKTCLALLVSASIALSGCHPQQPFYAHDDGDLSHYVDQATEIEYPDADVPVLPDVSEAIAPFTLTNQDSPVMWDLCLQDAVKLALANSKVFRSLAGRFSSSAFNQRAQVGEAPDAIVTNPDAIRTVYDPAITETTPFVGVEAALSAFDAQLSSSLVYSKNDRPQNVKATGALGAFFVPIFQEDTATFQAQISKVTATGGTFTVRNNIIYDQNNNPTRQVPSDYNVNYEMSFSQPLLQGAGVQYNRIAGPNNPLTGVGTPAFDGVLLARINTDISLADFEIAVRQLVRDVEDMYWELYFAYRNLEAAKTGRNSALQTWKKVHALYVVSGVGGEADKEAQARAQFFLFQSQLQTAKNDLYRAENRLRYIMGIGVTDGRLIRPKDEPTTAKVDFEWKEISMEGLARSVELRRQKWRIKERELELIAARNLLQPRLDINGTYRWLGLGDQLLGNGESNINAGLPDTNAYQVLGTGQFQEWQLGFNLNVPLGFRAALGQIRFYQLQLAKERSKLQEEEIELSSELADAVRNLEFNYVVTLTNLNRRIAAERQVDAIQAAYDAGKVTFDLLLDAQRLRADAESAYYRTLADYNRAIIQVHYRKGSLLEYNGVYLTEGPWPAKAQFDACRLARQRDASYYLNYGYTRPKVISQGPYQQISGEGSGQSGMPAPGEEVLPREAPEELPAPTPARTYRPSYDQTQPTSSADRPAAGRQDGPAVNQQRLAGGSNNRKPAFEWGSLGLDQPNPAAQPSQVARGTEPARLDERQAQNAQPVVQRPARTAVRQASATMGVEERSRAKTVDDGAQPEQGSTGAQFDPAQRKSSEPGATRAANEDWKATSYESVPDSSSGATDRLTSGWKGAQR